jgi:hypothetical protein
MDTCSYEIGGRKFTQKKLVWGQVKQINNLVKGVQIPAAGWTPADLIDILGDKLPYAVAILIIEDNIPLKDKNVDELAGFIEGCAYLETILQVIEDFFDINPISSILEKLGVGLRHLTKRVEEMNPKTRSTES